MNALERLLADRAAVPIFPAPAPAAPPAGALDHLLLRLGTTPEGFRDAVQQHAEATAKNKRPLEVPDSAELRRVAFLPRRAPPTAAELDHLVTAYTSALRTLRGAQSLRPVQAWALHELRQTGGMFGAIRVGGGKTLISWLALTAVGAKRPLIIVPAALRNKTRRDFRLYAEHWVGPPPDAVRVESYEYISHSGGVELDDQGKVTNPGFLATYAPDLIVCDEVQKISRKDAAVTKRFKRYMKDHPGTKFVALSGTVTKRSLRDYAHVLEWCLPNGCPLPVVWEFFGPEIGRQDTLGFWADALDEKVSDGRRLEPGALVRLAPEEAQAQARYGSAAALKVARHGFRSRLRETAGVAMTQESELKVGLTIREWNPFGQGRLGTPRSDHPDLEPHFRTLRSGWETPAGLLLTDAIQVWMCARQLGLGFFYEWDPPGPPEWMAARKEWAVLCRELAKTNKRHLETEAQIANAVARGIYPGLEVLDSWRAIRPTFEPNTRAVWLSFEAVEAAARWAVQGPGLIWTEHTEFALKLAEVTGLQYYGRGGLNAQGRMLEDHDPRVPCIVGIQANSAGRNLQAWNRNLIMCPPSNGLTWEQLTGRTHRDGQERDVTVDVYFGCQEHGAGYWQAVADSGYVQDTTGQVQKLCYARSEIPELDEIEGRGGMRWCK